jgi:hypothetical protein
VKSMTSLSLCLTKLLVVESTAERVQKDHTGQFSGINWNIFDPTRCEEKNIRSSNASTTKIPCCLDLIFHTHSSGREINECVEGVMRDHRNYLSIALNAMIQVNFLNMCMRLSGLQGAQKEEDY